jgi:hypothetical protein
VRAIVVVALAAVGCESAADPPAVVDAEAEATIDSAIELDSASEAAAETSAPDTGACCDGFDDPASTPAFMPAPGLYTMTTNVALSSADVGAKLFYTLDGSYPTTASTPYTAPIPITMGTVTIMAFALVPGRVESARVTGKYAIATGTSLVAPVLSPPGGEYDSNPTVSMATSSSGAEICYRTDGYTPVCPVGGGCGGSTVYVSPIVVPLTAAGTQVRAVTCGRDARSDVVLETYRKK